MASVEEFLKAPSEEFLERCSRDQLLRIAEHYELDVGDKRIKENIKNIIRENLIEAGVIGPKSLVAEVDVLSAPVAGLSFELTYAWCRNSVSEI